MGDGYEKNRIYPGIMTSWLILYCPAFCERERVICDCDMMASCVTRDDHWSVAHEAIIFTIEVILFLGGLSLQFLISNLRHFLLDFFFVKFRHKTHQDIS